MVNEQDVMERGEVGHSTANESPSLYGLPSQLSSEAMITGNSQAHTEAGKLHKSLASW